MKKNIIIKLNDEVELFTKNIKWDILENIKYDYLIVSGKPFFRIDKLKAFLIENEINAFAGKQLETLLDNCNGFLNLNQEYKSINSECAGFTVCYVDNVNLKEFRGSFGLNKKLVWFTGKTLMEYNEDEFLRIYRNKSISLYTYNYFTLSLIIKKLVVLISDVLNDKPQSREVVKVDEVKTELYPNIFKDNYFELWQSMFDAFEIKESSYSKDLDFMYNVMFDKGFINKNIGKKNMLDWVSEIYEITFSRIRYANYKDSSNKNRLIIFNEILENS